MNSNKNVISIIGDGSWGTTLAILLAKKEQDVILWTISEELRKDLSKYRENRKYLSGVPIPEKVSFTSDAEEAIRKSSMVVIAVPSPFFKDVLQKYVVPFADKSKLYISVAKGFDEETLHTIPE